MSESRTPKRLLDSTLVDTTTTQTVSGKDLSTGNTFPTFNQNTTGTAANVTGTVAVANGGTGANTLTGVIKGNGTAAISAAAAGTDYSVPGGAETFSGVKSFNDTTLVMKGATSGTTTLKATAAAGTTTATLPATTGTVLVDAATQTNTAAKTFNTNTLVLAGSVSGTQTINTGGATSGTVTFPSGTYGIVGDSNATTITGVKTFGAAGNVGKLVVAGTTSGTTVLNASAVAGTTTLTLPATTATVAAVGYNTGYITAAQITANFSSSTTTLTAVTGLTATFTANGISRYKVTVYSRDVFVSGGGVGDVTLWNGTVGTGTQVQGAEPNTPSGTAVPVTMVYYTPTPPTAGSITYNVGLKGATGVATMEAAATYPAYILVEAF